MANQSLQVSPSDLYSSGYVIKLSDGRQLLKRVKMAYTPTSTRDITHIVKDNDRIWDIAFRYYRNPLLWKVIADVNDIMNPFELTIGQELTIPDIDKVKLQVL